MTHLSPFFVAVVFIPGDVRAGVRLGEEKEASFGASVSIPRYFFFTSSSADPWRGGEAVGHQRGADAEQPQPISSSIRQPER